MRSDRRSLAHVRKVQVRGFNGLGTVGFVGGVKHGAGERLIAMHVDPAEIVLLADELRRQGVQPATRHHLSVDYGAVGHAVWHYDHRGVPSPCVQCWSVCPDCELEIHDESLDHAAECARFGEHPTEFN